jgi:uncharacterized membrane protein YgdD (TMEM256/DUF423 family)
MAANSRVNVWLLAGALLGGLSVALGAFGAHALESRLKEPDGTLTMQAERKIANWETATRYQMFHALALLGIGSLYDRRRSNWLQLSGAAMTAGTLVFSGCLYALVLTGQKALGATVPIGGVLMLIGWVLLAVGVATAGPAATSHP